MSDLVGVSLHFLNFTRTSEVFINIHETLIQKVRSQLWHIVKATICYQFLHAFAISSKDTNYFEGVPS